MDGVKQERPLATAHVGGRTYGTARIDVANTDRLRAIIAEHGWPGRVLVGDEGAEAARLIAQHADRQLDFQRGALALLERAVHEGDAPASHLAYLTIACG